MQTSTLRPGLLVSLNTSIRGNVSYAKETIEAARKTEDGAQVAKWQTERTIVDPVEHEAAGKARNKARSIITGVCAHSAFGYLCPEANADVLVKAIADARKVADDFNKNAKLTRVHVNIITGRIAPDDVEAVKAINSELRDLLADMAQGVQNCDVTVIRNAAARAKSVSDMLAPDAAARARIAIDAARDAAKRLVKAGEAAVQEIDVRAVRAITEARTSFLDLADDVAFDAPTVEGRAIDLAPELEVDDPVNTAPVVEID